MNNSPFPRANDGLPDAWLGDHGRFSDMYESRIQKLWQAIHDLGFTPVIDWAGSQDGEAVMVTDQNGEISHLIAHVEDPEAQEEIDKAIAADDLQGWVKRRMREDDEEASRLAEQI